MALDCYTLKMLADELNDKLIGGRIDKIYQMSRVQLLMTVRSLGENHRLYISCDASKGRVNLTTMKFENPDVPPVFCMLMRKHLSGGKITAITAVPNERIIKIEAENTNELFETVSKTLIVEIMGKHSNIILLNSDGRIIDCVLHVDFTISEKRQVLPGLYYEEPPKSEKKDPFHTDYSELLAVLKSNENIEKALMDNFSGMSPMLAREIVFRGNNDYIECAMEYEKILKGIKSGEKKPVMLCERSTEKPKELYFTDILQYGDFYEKKYFSTMNECADAFFKTEEQTRKLKEKQNELQSVVNKHIKKVSKKLDIHLKNVQKAKTKDKYRVYAELITANLYKLTKNAKSAQLENYYDDNKIMTVPMDETISPAKNAKKYFEKYNKEKNMEKISLEMIKNLENELSYLNEVNDMISICKDLKALSEIKDELLYEGYIEPKKNEKPKKKNEVSAPNEFVSSDGFTILSGKNNRQNEILSLKTAQKTDIWFHVRNAAGSHTILCLEGKEPTDTAIYEAAVIAAYYSKKSADSKADVDYTLLKYVKKPNGAKTGMVIYDNFKGITVEPSKELVESLKKRTGEG